MPIERPLRVGDWVRISTPDGRSVPALVRLASPNGRSIILFFDARIGNWYGQMPAFQSEAGDWSALDGLTIGLEFDAPTRRLYG